MPIYTQNKPKPSRTHQGPVFPQWVHEYLASGAHKGLRNKTLFNVACQFRDAGISIDDAKPRLVARAIEDGLSDSEAIKAIEQAYARDARSPLGGNGTNGTGPASNGAANSAPPNRSAPPPRSTAPPPQSVPLPSPITDGFRVLLETCFLPGEFVAIGEGSRSQNGDLEIDKGSTNPRERWIELALKKPLSEIRRTLEGVFVRVNPMKSGCRNDKDVTAYRHLLIEFDWDSNHQRISKEIQYARFLNSGLPISVITDSGNKSLQALVRLDAPDEKEFERRREIVWKYFESQDGFDRDVGNPSRYSRCPGFERNLYDDIDETKPTGKTGHQELLRVKVGAKSWDEWEATQAAQGAQSGQAGQSTQGGNPQDAERERLRKILARKNVRDLPDTPPLQLIGGLLFQGGKISFSAPPKLFKTWNLLHLFFCLANGLEYLGFKTVRVPVVIFDLELIEYDIRFRLEEIARFYNLPGDWSANLHIIPLRGQPVDFGNSITQEIVIETVKGAAAGAFGIDPLYKALTGYDENSNSDIAQVLKPFEQLTRECGAAFAYNQHFSKGNQSAKDPLDRIAGAGAFSRDPDALLTFTKHAEPDCFTVNVIQRSFPPIPAFVVRWQYPVLVRDTTGLDPADLELPEKVKGQAKKSEIQKKEILTAVVAAEHGGGITYTRLRAITGIPETSFRRHLKALIAAGEIYKSVANSNYQLTHKNAQKWGNVA